MPQSRSFSKTFDNYYLLSYKRTMPHKEGNLAKTENLYTY